MGLYEAMEKARKLFGITETKPSKAKTEVVPTVPWWVTMGYASMKEGVEDQLAKAKGVKRD